MFLRRFLRGVFGQRSRLADMLSRRRNRRQQHSARLYLEQLEDRVVPSLLGLAQVSVAPDIAGALLDHMSYTQIGNNANPFHYDAVPLAVTLGDGSMANITNPSGGGTPQTNLDLFLDNSGHFAAGVAGNDLTLTGKVTINGHTFDNTLLTGKVRDFGFSTPNRSDTEFEVRVVVTGGELAQQPLGVYRAGTEMGLLIHEPGVPVTSFPKSFSITSHAGAYDLRKIINQPLNQQLPNQPLSPGQGGINTCGCGTTSDSANGNSTDNANNAVSLAETASQQEAITDLEIPGRNGLDFTMMRAYDSDINSSGPLGHNWDFSYDRRLFVVTPDNLHEVQQGFPSAKVGDVERIDGLDRFDLYTLNPDGSYTDPTGFFTQLVLNPDGSYTERDSTGDIVSFGKPEADGTAQMMSFSDRQGDSLQFQYDGMGRLTTVIDPLGRPIQFMYDSQSRIDEVQDYVGRTITYQYDTHGNLMSETGPAVTGTPTGNDFSTGKTTRYTYSSGYSLNELNGELLTVTAPNEVADGGPPRLTFVYDTNPHSPTVGDVLKVTEGGTDQTGVPAGGTTTYQYQVIGSASPGDFSTPVYQTTATDRNGNRVQYQFNQLGNIVDLQQDNNRDIRPSDPAFYETRYTYNGDYLMLSETDPLGNRVQYVYDSSNPDRFQQGNLLSETQLPDAGRGGDQTAIQTTYTYEPIYNQIHSMTEPRGNDPSYVPQNGGSTSAAHYTTTYTYDYQEGTNYAGLAAVIGGGITAAQVQAELTADGIPMGLGDVNGDGRTDQIAGNLIRMQQPTVTLLPGSNEAAVEGTTQQPIVTLYTYNDFGQLTSKVDPEGNVSQYQYNPVSDPDGNGDVDNPSGNPTTGGYLKETDTDTTSNPGRDSGTNPAPASIRNLYFYDEVGNVTRSVDGRGIATDYVYNQLNQVVETITASAVNVYSPNVTEPLPLTAFQYTTRYFYDFNNNLVLQETEDRGNTSNVQGNPPAAALPVLNVQVAGTSTGGNTAATLNDTTQSWTLNQWVGFAVRIVSGPGVGLFAMIVSNTATQLTVSPSWTTTPTSSSHYAIYQLINPDPIGGATAYVDTVYKYDILDQQVEMDQEVSNGGNPQFLTTRYRYDPNGNQVLTIAPEGNAIASFYDERDLLYQSTQGATSPPPLAELATTDPHSYNVRGGLAATTTYNYDLNGNLIETVAADDTDGSLSNNSKLPSGTSTGGNSATTLNDNHQSWMTNQWQGRTVLIVSGTDAGDVRTIASNTNHQLVVTTAWTVTPDSTSVYAFQGDRTRYVYDGFDRRVAVIDSVGNETVTQYDPAGNVVRTSSFGPTGGPSATSDGPDTLPGPVSQNGVIQSGNLVNSNLLSSTETMYDEVGRTIETKQVLFVNTIPTLRPPDVAEGGSDVGLGSLNPGDTGTIPGVLGITVLGRVADRTEYDRDSRVTFTVEDDLNTTRTFYDGVSRPIMTTDGAGNTVETAYDGDSNVIETRETDVSQVSGVANEIFLTTNFYDSLDRLQETVDNLGHTSYYRYDSRDNLVATADAAGPLTGNTVTRRAFPDGPRTVDAINDFGNVTLYFYDGMARQTRQEVILTPTGQGDGTHIGASIQGVKNDPSATESFTPAPDPSQGGGDGIIRTETVYDANSLTSAQIDDNGNVTLYLYDNLDRRVAQSQQLTVSLATGASTGGNTATTLNDTTQAWAANQWKGDSVQITAGTGAGQVRTITSNTATQLVVGAAWTTIPDATSTYRVFTPLTNATILGARVIMTPTATTINNPATISAATINAQLAEIQSGLSAVAALFPPPPSQVVAAPTTNVTGYDPNGNVLIHQDENGTEVFTKYDGSDRALAVRVFRAGQHDSFAGDPIFAPAPVHIYLNPSQNTVVTGTTIQNFQYDGLSRVTRAFDNNNPTTSSDDSTVTDAYDSLSRVIEETQQTGALPAQPIDSAWRADGLRKSLTYPNGRVEVYAYDHLDRLATVADQGAAQDIADYFYIGVGRVLERIYPINGTRETYLDNSGTVDSGYDGDGRPIEERDLRSDNSVILDFTYTYDRMNNKLTQGQPSDPAYNATYTYDSAYRLITFVGGTGNHTWALDGTGNWTSVDGETRQHNSGNELIQRKNVSTTNLTYDSNGNETFDGTYVYTYDFMNRLRTVTRKAGGALIAVYSYDADGRRIESAVTNSGALNGTTYFYLDGWQEIEEHNAGNLLTQQYVYGSYIDEPLAIDRNLNNDNDANGPEDQRLFYYQNTLYSVYALADTTAKIVEGYQYDAYGKQTTFQAPGLVGVTNFTDLTVVTTGGSSKFGNPYLFTGRRLDPETGLYYYRARYLDPVAGRFISRDYFQHVEWTNLYTYTDDQPTFYVDPWGLLKAETGYRDYYYDPRTGQKTARGLAFQIDAWLEGNCNAKTCKFNPDPIGDWKSWVEKTGMAKNSSWTATKEKLQKFEQDNAKCPGGKEDCWQYYLHIKGVVAKSVSVGAAVKSGIKLEGVEIGFEISRTVTANEIQWEVDVFLQLEICCNCDGGYVKLIAVSASGNMSPGFAEGYLGGKWVVLPEVKK